MNMEPKNDKYFYHFFCTSRNSEKIPLCISKGIVESVNSGNYRKLGNVLKSFKQLKSMPVLFDGHGVCLHAFTQALFSNRPKLIGEFLAHGCSPETHWCSATSYTNNNHEYLSNALSSELLGSSIHVDEKPYSQCKANSNINNANKSCKSSNLTFLSVPRSRIIDKRDDEHYQLNESSEACANQEIDEFAKESNFYSVIKAWFGKSQRGIERECVVGVRLMNELRSKPIMLVGEVILIFFSHLINVHLQIIERAKKPEFFLVAAAAASSAKVVRRLLEKGVNPNYIRWGFTPLLCAVASSVDAYEKTELLLSYGADPNWSGINSANRWTLGCRKIIEGASSAASIYVSRIIALKYSRHLEGSKLRSTNPGSICSFNLFNQKQLSQNVLRVAAARLMCTVIEGTSESPPPLMIAMEARRCAIARLLLENGANPDVCIDDTWSSPLFNAILWGDFDAVQLLLLWGANIFILKHGRYTASKAAQDIYSFSCLPKPSHLVKQHIPKTQPIVCQKIIRAIDNAALKWARIIIEEAESVDKCFLNSDWYNSYEHILKMNRVGLFAAEREKLLRHLNPNRIHFPKCMPWESDIPETQVKQEFQKCNDSQNAEADIVSYACTKHDKTTIVVESANVMNSTLNAHNSNKFFKAEHESTDYCQRETQNTSFYSERRLESAACVLYTLGGDVLVPYHIQEEIKKNYLQAKIPEQIPFIGVKPAVSALSAGDKFPISSQNMSFSEKIESKVLRMGINSENSSLDRTPR